MLTDAPYTYVPYDGSNPYAGSQNKENGGRIMSTDVAYTVGTWIIEWQFVSCSASCPAFFKKK